MKKNKSNTFGFIYTVKNQITGQYYVGATTDSMEQRKLDHEERAIRGEDTKLAKAIATYGSDTFQWNITDTANNTNELAEKEKAYIIKYDSKENGYNSSLGGEFKKKVFQFDKETGELINSFDSITEASMVIGCSKACISKSCLNENRTCHGYVWSYSSSIDFELVSDKRTKRVLMVSSLGSGKANQVFNSVAEASRATGLSKSSISRVCRGERKQAGGYDWKYI